MFALGTVLSLLIGVSLGFFGGGGSILTVPLLVYVFGLETKAAIASSLLIVGMASISGALQHWRAGNLRPREGLVFGAAGMVGAYAGGRASAFLDGGLLLLLFAAMMLLTAGAMWRGRKDGMDPRSTELWSPGRLVLQGVVVGAFTGLIGAYIIIGPNFSAIGWGALLPAAAAVCFAVASLITRFWAATAGAMMFQLITALTAVALLTAMMAVGTVAEVALFTPRWPTGEELALLLFAGIGSTPGSRCTWSLSIFDRTTWRMPRCTSRSA